MHEKYETTYFADDRTVTIDEAVAKLIGWMRTERRIPHLQVTLDGIDRTQFVRLYRLPEPLMKIIHDERETARLKLFEAADAWFASTKSSEFSDKKRNELFEIVAAREADFDYWDNIGEQAAKYFKAIEASLDRKNSPLKTDRSNPDRIVTASLRDWAKRQFKIDIDEQDPAKVAKPRNKGQLVCRVILKTITELGYEPTELPKTHTSNRGGIKAEVRKQLVTPGSQLFQHPERSTEHQKRYETKLFNRQWENLLKAKKIGYTL